MYPVYRGSYERGGGGGSRPASSNAWRDAFIPWAKDLGRSIDYLETRSDIDRTRLAYYGLSTGATVGPLMIAVDGRFRTAVFESGGLLLEPLPAEADPFNFAPRVKASVLMLNGRYDFVDPVDSSQIPL